MSSPPRILVSGWAGAGNVGDELLTASVVAIVNSAGATPVVASRDPAATRRQHPSAESVPWGPRGVWSLRGIDGVCVGPGGIIQDSSSLWSLPGHLGPALLARLMGRPITGAGLGAEPLGRRSSRWLVRRVFAGAEPVVRDSQSAEVFAAAGADCHVGADLAFGAELALDAASGPADGIVVAIGPTVKPGRMSRAGKRLVAENVHSVAAAIDQQARRLRGEVTFVSFRGERDFQMAHDVADLMSEPTDVPTLDVDASIQRVADARMVITSRYHAAVVAVRAGVPALVVSDQAKLGSLITQVGDPRRLQLCTDWAGLASREPPGALADGLVVPGAAKAAHAIELLVEEARGTHADRVGR